MSEKKSQQEEDWNVLDDDILVKAHLQGDERAFQVLFKKYREMIGGLVFSIVKEESQVEDISQDVFLIIHRNLAKFRGQSALKTWIYRIAVNEALRFLNKSKRWVSLPDNDWERSRSHSTIVVFNQGESPERIMIDGERKVFVQEAIDALKPPHRVILTLFYLQDMDVKEISEILEIPEGSVKSRLFYARDALKKALKPLMGSVQLEAKGSHVL